MWRSIRYYGCAIGKLGQQPTRGEYQDGVGLQTTLNKRVADISHTLVHRCDHACNRAPVLPNPILCVGDCREELLLVTCRDLVRRMDGLPG